MLVSLSVPLMPHASLRIPLQIVAQKDWYLHRSLFSVSFSFDVRYLYSKLPDSFLPSFFFLLLLLLFLFLFLLFRRGAQVEIVYAVSDQSVSCRQVHARLQLCVKRGIEITGMEILPYQPAVVNPPPLPPASASIPSLLAVPLPGLPSVGTHSSTPPPSPLSASAASPPGAGLTSRPALSCSSVSGGERNSGSTTIKDANAVFAVDDYDEDDCIMVLDVLNTAPRSTFRLFCHVNGGQTVACCRFHL